ncbi:hypothetical protein V1225_01400 [Emergencia sp. JLR.KK010]|uniref:hypothetical protein n=1 Tax=Emergencia sp. JLR.KK010 TaxID=3114296 RepID=UPI0030D57DAB
MVDEMRKMRTAEEMFAYYHEHKDPEKKKGLFAKNVSDDDRWRDLKLAEFILESDEYILSFFWAYIYIYMTCLGIRTKDGYIY